MVAYYNDSDPFCAAWLPNLIAAGAIPAGTVDERSIADIDPGDLAGYRHVHFFAGIGGWAYALQLAGWPDDRPVWTGSCPCQPFSSAGRQGGALDERHLWPRWFRLIRECRPHTILGEQVERAVGFGWVDRVFADLEDEGYATGAAVLGAHSVGAPHIRQRLFWVAQSDGAGRQSTGAAGPYLAASERGASGGVADPADARCDDARQHDGGSPSLPARSVEHGNASGLADATERWGWGNGRAFGSERSGASGGLGNAAGEQVGRARQPWQDSVWSSDSRMGNSTFDGCGEERADARGRGEGDRAQGSAERSGPGFWSDAVWLPCLDGKARRVEPTIQPLAAGIPNRVGLLRGSGNAITPQTAALFIEAVMECLP